MVEIEMISYRLLELYLQLIVNRIRKPVIP